MYPFSRYLTKLSDEPQRITMSTTTEKTQKLQKQPSIIRKTTAIPYIIRSNEGAYDLKSHTWYEVKTLSKRTPC